MIFLHFWTQNIYNTIRQYNRYQVQKSHTALCAFNLFLIETETVNELFGKMTEACEYPECCLCVCVYAVPCDCICVHYCYCDVCNVYGMRNCQNDAQQGIESDSVNETDICMDGWCGSDAVYFVRSINRNAQFQSVYRP